MRIRLADREQEIVLMEPDAERERARFQAFLQFLEGGLFFFIRVVVALVFLGLIGVVIVVNTLLAAVFLLIFFLVGVRVVGAIVPAYKPILANLRAVELEGQIFRRSHLFAMQA